MTAFTLKDQRSRIIRSIFDPETQPVLWAIRTNVGPHRDNRAAASLSAGACTVYVDCQTVPHVRSRSRLSAVVKVRRSKPWTARTRIRRIQGRADVLMQALPVRAARS